MESKEQSLRREFGSVLLGMMIIKTEVIERPIVPDKQGVLCAAQDNSGASG